jgi:hypothetical protein
MKEEYKDLEELKRAMQKKQEHPEEEAELKISREDMFKAVLDLSSQIKELVDIFKLASEGMKAEDNAYEEVKGKLDTLLKNDQDLAKGVLMVIENQKEGEENIAKMREQQIQQQGIQPMPMSMPMNPQPRMREMEPLSPTLPRRESVRTFNLLNAVYPNLQNSPQPVRVMQEKEPEEPVNEDENLSEIEAPAPDFNYPSQKPRPMR